MKKGVIHWLTQIYSNVIVYLLCAIGFILSISSFFGVIQISPPFLVAVLDLLVIEIIRQNASLEKIKDEIIGSLRGVYVEVFTDKNEFADVKKRLIKSARRIYDMELCLPYTINPSSATIQESKHSKLLNKKIKKRKLTYKFIQVCYDKGHFEKILRKLFQFNKYNYYIGCFIGAPEVIPALNVMIFDEKHFLIGGYYGPTARGNDRNLYIQSEEIGKTFLDYFNYLWSKAKLLNDNHKVDWEIIKDCGSKLGFTMDELNSTIARIANQVGFSEVTEIK